MAAEDNAIFIQSCEDPSHRRQGQLSWNEVYKYMSNLVSIDQLACDIILIAVEVVGEPFGLSALDVGIETGCPDQVDIVVDANALCS